MNTATLTAPTRPVDQAGDQIAAFQERIADLRAVGARRAARDRIEHPSAAALGQRALASYDVQAQDPDGVWHDIASGSRTVLRTQAALEAALITLLSDFRGGPDPVRVTITTRDMSGRAIFAYDTVSPAPPALSRRRRTA